MRIRYRNKAGLNLQRAGAVLMLLIPFSVLGTMVVQITSLFDEIPGFGVSEDLKPDPATFIPANYTRLAEMAEYYASQYENYHMPLNFTVGASFD